MRNDTPDGGGGQAASALYRHVDRQIRRLQEGYLADDPWAVSTLAKLRLGIGRPPGEIFELSQVTTAGVYVEDFDSDEVTSEEEAAYTAITLYSLHQQGHRQQRMHRQGRSFGAAARELKHALGEAGESGVIRRFNAIGTATSVAELVRHARGLIQQFSAEDIPMDYALFADDLRKLMRPDNASRVRNRWARHLYRQQRADATHTFNN